MIASVSIVRRLQIHTTYKHYTDNTVVMIASVSIVTRLQNVNCYFKPRYNVLFVSAPRNLPTYLDHFTNIIVENSSHEVDKKPGK